MGGSWDVDGMSCGGTCTGGFVMFIGTAGDKFGWHATCGCWGVRTGCEICGPIIWWTLCWAPNCTETGEGPKGAAIQGIPSGAGVCQGSELLLISFTIILLVGSIEPPDLSKLILDQLLFSFDDQLANISRVGSLRDRLLLLLILGSKSIIFLIKIIQLDRYTIDDISCCLCCQ